MPNNYKRLFDNAPVSIIELDYGPMSDLRHQIGSSKASAIRSFLLKNPSLLKKAYGNVKVLNANRGALDFYKVKSNSSLVLKIVKSFNGRALDLLVEQFVALFSGEKEFCGEMKCSVVKGQAQDVFMRVVADVGKKGAISSVIMTLQDITAWKKLERQLLKKAQMDGLTKMLNQRAVIERLDNELVRAKRYGLELSCMMIDLDFFKVINDKFGHQKGDAILKKVSVMIRSCFRKLDIVGRYGGDEFMVILPETGARNAYYAALRLQKSFARELFKYRNVITFHITLSIGIAGYSVAKKKIEDANDLIALADNEMYNCKKAGRNRISVAGIEHQ